MNDVIVGSIREVEPQVTQPSSEELKIYHPWMKDDTSIPPYIRILNKSVEYDPSHAQWDELEVWANHFFHQAFPLLDFDRCNYSWERRQKIVNWIRKESSKDWWKRLHCRLWGHDEEPRMGEFGWNCKRCGAKIQLIDPIMSDHWFYPTYHILRFIRGYPDSVFAAINVYLYYFAFGIIFRLPKAAKSPFAHFVAALLWLDYALFYPCSANENVKTYAFYKRLANKILTEGNESTWLKIQSEWSES